MNVKLFFLLVIFQLKHFLADYPLQNEYMLGKFKKEGWILPLSCHALVHAAITVIICLFFTELYVSIWLGIFDFVIHFTMDRIKASPDMLGKYSAISKQDYESYLETKKGLIESESATEKGRTRFLEALETDFEVKKESNKKFWWSLGLDQGIHHLTHYVIIVFLM